MPDDRAILAEYGDLLRLRPDHRDKEQTKQLPFDQLSLPDGPVLDIGAGTGLGTVALATALPDREVWAVEPDPTSRAVLHARVADAGLMEQVTVFASDLESADLPARCAGGIGIHILCQVTNNGGRPAFLKRLVDALAPGGEVIVDVCFGPAKVWQSDLELDTETRLGRRTLQRWSEVQPVGEHQVRTSHTFTVLDDETVVSTATTSSVFTPALREQVHAEIADAGLATRPAGERFLILSRAA